MATRERSATHPLDPLTPVEIERAAAVVRETADIPASIRFIAMSTAEPPRRTEGSHPRMAEVVVYDPPTRATFELAVDVERGTAGSVRRLTGVEPQLTIEEILSVEEAVRADPRFHEAIRRRGIEDPSLVDVDPAAAGSYGTPEEAGGGRLVRILCYARPEEGANTYAGPLEGIFGVFDLSARELVHFEDRDPVPVPDESGEYRADRLQLREDVRPIHISQPEGPSFQVDGHEVRWQKWSFRVGFSSRNGLVLHQIGYDDEGVIRPILHRAAYAEMVVPYADPDRFYQAPLDIGEFNVGTFTNPLTLGCDCLGVIHYFDAAYVDPDGNAVEIPNAICLHEEDDGMLWKHTDFRTDHVEVRRGRKLVISSVVTVGNYEYGFFWYLHQDGSISSEVKATGIVSTQAVAENKPTPYGKLVAPYLNAIHHQHVFCVRLDFDLDGGGNTVMEVHTEAVPEGPDNPHGNAWVTRARPLSTELDARRHLDAESARGWVVVNPTQRNVVGEPVGYRLVPGENTMPFSASGSSTRRRAAFMDYHLWVTRYAEDERYPAGEYPYQHKGGDGLPRWVEANREIEDTDLVLWYTMNHHHVPRPEDWPVMPVARIGFMLKPWGFFDRSPAIDVPPTEPGSGSCHA
jgi:primary-amine oxidase